MRTSRLALSVVLCSEHRDRERFEEAFAAVFGDGRPRIPHDPSDDIAALGEIPQEVLPQAGAADPSGEQAAPDAEPVPAAWSDIEVLVHKDFARYTEAENALARDLIARLARRHPMRLSRRTQLSRRRGHAPDLRATVQASLRTGGEPLARRWRAPTERPRQLVLVCDVSGSMTPYARMLLQYMQASVAARRRVEAFAFGTRLTRITQELAGRDPDAGARARHRCGHRLLRRHPDRCGARRAQPRARPAARPRGGRRRAVRRLGPRRARAAA